MLLEMSISLVSSENPTNSLEIYLVIMELYLWLISECVMEHFEHRKSKLPHKLYSVEKCKEKNAYIHISIQ